MDACLLLKSLQRDTEACGGALNFMWVISWQDSNWDADYVRITAKTLWLVLPLNFGRMISGPPQTVSRLRQYAWEWEFALERVAFIERIV